MSGRERKAPPNSADLRVCFPSRAHLTLKPKPICSPSRPPEPNKHHHPHRRRRRRRHHPSPLMLAQPKSNGSREITEPTSPRVTCAGQIRVRPKPGACGKTWQSVMEEIERLHNNKTKHSKGAPNSVTQFLSCLQRIRLDFQCFRSFHTTDLASDNENEEEDEKNYRENEKEGSTVFSKWFMVLQEEHSKVRKEESGERDCSVLPPPNALLLMRCRSAPAKSLVKVQGEEEEEEEEEEDDDEGEDGGGDEHKKEDEEINNLKVNRKEKKRISLATLMRDESDSDKFSCDVVKETWVVGGLRDPFSRSRSWKS